MPSNANTPINALSAPVAAHRPSDGITANAATAPAITRRAPDKAIIVPIDFAGTAFVATVIRANIAPMANITPVHAIKSPVSIRLRIAMAPAINSNAVENANIIPPTFANC